ncbi:hypothetical protein N800_09805 [Lysobacter daejeonensis GH1-9]|uniref:Sugar transporter n=2 Tax=Aerolutibacter TaxID=3382701 RepID=A0A0A0ESB6_9GAMM|nr:lipoprotein [Lysobacter daejeonensis]KGM53135.1 hypothetical protein N800_09805 [Lysobacter daejeonensis GH1-9]
MKLKTAMLLIALSLPLAGCGNKGPLVLPQAPVPVDETAPVEAPVDEAPVDPVPEDATTPDPAATDASAPPAAADPDPVPATQDGDG